MNKLTYPLTCFVLLFTNIGRGDDLPFLSLLREEVANQLTIVSNTVPLDKKLAAGLRTNLKLIDRTKPTFINGSAALGTLARTLGKTSLSNIFLPILIDTRTVYINAMETEMSALEDRLADTIPGKARTAAQTALDKLSAALADAATNPNFTASLTSLKKAATALVAAQKSVVKAEAAQPGASFLTATITESNQGVTTLNATKNMMEAYYDSFFEEIHIDAGAMKSLGGGRFYIRGLSLTAIVPGAGPGPYSLSLTNDTQGYALYACGIVRNPNAEEPEVESEEVYFTIDPTNETFGTGTLTITVDWDANIVWGTFTFTAHGSEDTDLEVSITGSFFVRLEVFDDEE